MANELVHSSVGTTLTQAEFEAVGLHICNSQATGDLIYASSASQLSRLGIGTANQVLITSGGIPAWSSTITSATLTTCVASGAWTASGTWTIPAVTLGGAITGASQNMTGIGTVAATSLATTAATPLLLTNGQLVNIALTSQTTGATTLTIPDFASVVDEFTFKTKAQTMANKTLTSPTINGTIATTGLTLPAFTLGDAVTGNGKTITGLSTITVLGTTYLKCTADDSYVVLGGGTDLNAALIILSGKNRAGNTGDLLLATTNAAAAYTVRLTLTGGANTSVAAWTNTTQTWSSYGAGALTTDASGNITAVSDERLKDIQGKFNRGLAEILTLEPILYKWNKLSKLDTENTYAGFSSQNVMKYIPEAVGKQPDGYYSLNDRPILASVVNAIRELQGEINEIKDKLGLSRPNLETKEYSDEAGILVSKPEILTNPLVSK